MTEIIFATKNKNKVIEINEYAKELNLDVKFITMEEAGITKDVVEDGKTFAENAYKKAVEIGKISKKITMADDSGLEIDYMNNEPGIHSARYLGRDSPYEYKNNHILKLLKNAKEHERGARFVCVIATYVPNESTFIHDGFMEGKIAHEAKGENGFGYDPIFAADGFGGKTNAEITLEEKNQASHRGKAFRQAMENLKKYV